MIGHVVITQADIRITCDRAIQYLARNDAILIGNVVVTQDTLTIEAEKGYYYGDEKIAKCTTGVKLNDGKVVLTAINGDYFFKESRAHFANNVTLYDTVSTLKCNVLNYYKIEERAVAVGRVSISDSVNTILSDSLVHLRRPKITYAEKNVKITNSSNNAVIYGGHLEDYSMRKYTLITDNPLLIQIDTTEGGGADSLIIASTIMESYNDSTQKFIATDSVRILRGVFSSRNDYSVYYRSQEKIVTYKAKEEDMFPVLWYETSQLTGDSVNIFIPDNKLDRIEVFRNGFILSRNEEFSLRYDQISGDSLTIYFDTTGIHYTDVDGNVLSIYYMYDNNEVNGLTKSASQKAKIFFAEKKVSEVKLYISPTSEYHPENVVEGNEQTYTLPGFIVIGGRPQKRELLADRRLD